MRRDQGAWADNIRRRTRFSFILFLIGGGIITASALADRIFNLGWGYGRLDALAGLGILLSGCFIYLCCVGIFRLLRGTGL